MLLQNLPFRSAVAVTPNDATVCNYTGLYIGGAGDVAVEMKGGGVVTFTAPPVGTTLNIQVVKVMSTNTTATLILGLS